MCYGNSKSCTTLFCVQLHLKGLSLAGSRIMLVIYDSLRMTKPLCHPFLHSVKMLQGWYRSWKTWKVMEFKNFIFKAWKVMKFNFLSLKAMEN